MGSLFDGCLLYTSAERREKIEGELPRFVATVEQELGASRDVLTRCV